MDDARAERLAAKAQQAAQLSSQSKKDVRALYLEASQAQHLLHHHQDQRYLSLAPAFLSLHHQAAASTELLDSLQSFLSTFQTDLSSLSSHISALQNTSHAIDTRLEARRAIETELAQFLSDISLSPRVVELFFDTEPDSNVELWKKAVRQLERVLESTSPGALRPPTSSSAAGDAGPISAENPAIKEARIVAEACKNIVASKLRNYLLSPYASIRASVTTNLQVLQTSILLQHHRPFYAFLARQMPRVAIDVQRSYVAAARLYFETAFRRYARSIGVIKARWNETAGGLITEPSTASSSSAASAYSGAAAMAFLSRPAASSQASRSGSGGGDGNATPASADPWELDMARLEHSRLDGPSIVLGYMADDSSFRASPESLFRALSLVLVDNACSEFTFLARFFENLQDEGGPDAQPSKTANGDQIVAPDESASAAGEATDDVADARVDPEPSVVQLSRSEQRQMKGRGASDEIFKQVLEPALSTWATFAKTLLSPAPPLLSLLTMLRLNDVLLSVVGRRGCSTPLLESTLMGFKIQAFPLLKKQFDEQIEAVRKLHGGNAGAGAGGGGGGSGQGKASEAPAGLDMMKGMFRAAVGGGSASAQGAGKVEVVRMVATRYASLVSRMAYLFDEDEDEGLSANLLRLRTEVERLFDVHASRAAQGEANSTLARLYDVVIKGLEVRCSFYLFFFRFFFLSVVVVWFAWDGGDW
ncbi:Vacuolar protein sorting-associated protein 52 [Thecaphora frezii]